jgi:hypothetical protein
MASVAEVVVKRLTVHLGPHTARVAMKTCAKQALGLAPELVMAPDAPKVLEALRPMLRTLLGSDHGEAIIRELTLALRG